ncbi:hypothetical protein SAMN04487948_11347 [Halogranum amylolyticum]|uniref:Uncharacterized protein n=1 Tax=Halogranum amylolyticum TaxID=660520 RepID=A0A1H8UY04_9EURY|nr:hypothetical protein [Halogranum amylolyticum]SEP08102.1 hypothetical protein SAMN04487948_11347 [Halogranum amylolyticum]
MSSSGLSRFAAGQRFVSVGLRVAGIILLALLVELYIGMTLITVPFLLPEQAAPVRDLLMSFVRLTGVSLAVVYGIANLQ